MVDKLSKDLNIIQRSNIEVQIDPITADLNIIQALDDEPNDVGGLSAQELKAKFDEAGNIIKTFINDSLIPQVTAETVSEEQRELNEQQRQNNEAQRQANEQVRQANEAERKAAEAARAVWEDYDPAKAYVPGNKVYWAGSSYVNKAPCTGVPPNVAANWQMVAKRGETVGSGMTEEDADERYLQLSGGWMTGPMTVLEPELPNSPATKEFVEQCVSAIPPKESYMVIFQESGTFSPSEYGLEAGDIVCITAVAGGQGGAGIGYYPSVGAGAPAGKGARGAISASSGGDGSLTQGGLGGRGSSSYGSPGGGGGGGGFGGGGGGGFNNTNREGAYGGAAGAVAHKTAILPNINPIAVTVGNGSSETFVDSFNSETGMRPTKQGESSSFGDILTATGLGAQGGVGGTYNTDSSKNFSGNGGNGGFNGSPGEHGESASYPSGGGGAGGYVIPNSALHTTVIGTFAPGRGVVVVEWEK